MDKVVSLSASKYRKKIAIINKVYSDLLRMDQIRARDVRSVDILHKTKGKNLEAYYRGYLKWRPNAFTCACAWDLDTSEYEKERHELEVSVLKEIAWKKLVECGACQGAFTELLCRAFPEREIVAFEPDLFFFNHLTSRIGQMASTVCGDINTAASTECDVLFASSCVYYMEQLPYSLLKNRAKYLVVSHELQYHEEVLDPILKVGGYQCILERDLAARIEAMNGLQETRYGTNVKVYSK